MALDSKMRLGYKAAKELIDKLHPGNNVEKNEDEAIFKLNGETVGQHFKHTEELYYRSKMNTQNSFANGRAKAQAAIAQRVGNAKGKIDEVNTFEYTGCRLLVNGDVKFTGTRKECEDYATQHNISL